MRCLEKDEAKAKCPLRWTEIRSLDVSVVARWTVECLAAATRATDVNTIVTNSQLVRSGSLDILCSSCSQRTIRRALPAVCNILPRDGRSPSVSTVGSGKRDVRTGRLYLPLSVLTFTIRTTGLLPGYFDDSCHRSFIMVSNVWFLLICSQFLPLRQVHDVVLFPSIPKDATPTEVGSFAFLDEIMEPLVSVKEVREQTSQDALLKKVLQLIRQGWTADSSKLAPELRPFFVRGLDITEAGGFLLWGIRLIIPSKPRNRSLQSLYHCHHSGTSNHAPTEGRHEACSDCPLRWRTDCQVVRPKIQDQIVESYAEPLKSETGRQQRCSQPCCTRQSPAAAHSVGVPTTLSFVKSFGRQTFRRAPAWQSRISCAYGVCRMATRRELAGRDGNVRCLDNRFGRKDVVIQNHIRKLLEMEPCVGTSAEKLQQLHNRLNLNVRELRALGKDLTSSRITAVEIMMELFNLRTRAELSSPTTETVGCVKELKQLMETAGFCLTKWSSNEPTVLRSLPEKDVASDCKPKMALGIVWDNKEDTITFPAICVERSDQQMTKRGMMSEVMKNFDPLGYLSPFLVKAKRMLQVLWRKGIDWDIPLPQNMLKDWQDWITEIPSILEIRLPRCLLLVGTDCIKELTDAQWWRYCPTTDNPADVLTRGCRLKDLVSNNLWWHGPHWLTECEDAWPTAKLELTIDRSPEFQAEVRKSTCELHVQAKTEAVLDVQKYSSLTKLLNVTAYVFCFITNCKVTPEERKTTPLHVREIDQAEQFWLKTLQNEEFPEELVLLKRERNCRKWTFTTLRPPVPHEISTPVVKSTPVSEAVGERSTHSTFTCWSRSCTVLSTPEILDGEWSLYRETEHGSDLAGPLYVREGNSVRKVYICLFTCMTTRAIHLELVSSLTAQRFLQAHDRFFARRGQPRIIQSDNFTSFKEIGQSINELVRETHRTLTSKRIEWKYITPRAPWCGGYLELLVRLVKTALRKALRRTSLDEEESHSSDAPYCLNHLESTTNAIGGLTKRWRYRKKLIAHFWKKWRSEYSYVLYSIEMEWRYYGTESIDAYSKSSEVGMMKMITKALIEKLREWFTRHGVPATIVTDIGPVFRSQGF
ncbi:conserved hypothetical protein [Trichinella spiralis]|uniref:Integrase catalytic domain-containing protein n=1 Tax=Trichinella spiralis TaxID=6334 RepID=E5S0Q5_TRISP|nr:conserved hypothetical protein [Trichinella spiralis]KRY33215.1 hypothetical protein T01_4395 [Trichinella spiralis]